MIIKIEFKQYIEKKEKKNKWISYGPKMSFLLNFNLSNFKLNFLDIFFDYKSSYCSKHMLNYCYNYERMLGKFASL